MTLKIIKCLHDFYLIINNTKCLIFSRKDKNKMDISPKGTGNGGVELQQITVVTETDNPSFEPESNTGPSHYINNNSGASPTTSNDGMHDPQSVANGDTLSPPDTNIGRKRHKSDGAIGNGTSNTSIQKSNLLDPNRKNSMYESKSTISGIPFDDSFLGKIILGI